MENLIVDSVTYGPGVVYEENVILNGVASIQKVISIMEAWINEVGDFVCVCRENKQGITIRCKESDENYVFYGSAMNNQFNPSGVTNTETSGNETVPVASEQPKFTFIFKENMFILQYSYTKVARKLLLVKDVNGQTAIMYNNSDTIGDGIKNDTVYTSLSFNSVKQIAKERLCLVPYYDWTGENINGLYECVADESVATAQSTVYKDSTGKKWWVSAMASSAPTRYLSRTICDVVFATQVQ